jgi:hypothetical protein
MDFYEGSLVYDWFDKEEDAHEFMSEYMDVNLQKVFIAVFDPLVKGSDMTKEIVEAVKVTGTGSDD